MDAACAAAHRKALARPDDPAARRAYAAQLRRLDRRAAALHELAAAAALEGAAPPPPEPVPDPEGGPPWILRLAPTPLRPLARVLPPETLDPFVPGALLEREREARSPALVPWPVCEGCAASRAGPGREECRECRGYGEVVEWTGHGEDRSPCPECEGEGAVACAACEGAGVAASEEGRPADCPHVLVPEEAPGAGPAALLRCERCFLTALRLPGGAEPPACAVCGRFRCTCA